MQSQHNSMIVNGGQDNDGQQDRPLAIFFKFALSVFPGEKAALFTQIVHVFGKSKSARK